MYVTECDYWIHKEYYAELLHQAEQARLVRNQKSARLSWRSLLTQILGTIQETSRNRLISWGERLAKKQVHRLEDGEISSVV